MNLALNPFDKGKKPEKLDEVELKDETLEGAINVFNNLVGLNHSIPVRNIVYCIRNCGLGVLSPSQIMLFHDYVKNNHPKYVVDGITGVVLTEYIKMSYDAGYREFELDAGEFRLWHLAHDMKYPEKYKITVNGDIRDSFKACENGIFIVNGDVMNRSFSALQNCYCEVNGNIEYLGSIMSEDCTFVFNGELNPHVAIYSRNCVFKVKDEQTKSKMDWAVQNKKENKVELI
ncbi:hypothetical protein KY330_05775 [Candidatus Woesearchaeota archaeon]|nr:hypothetical protein [Candidatus Woesearchaeota archaeon]